MTRILAARKLASVSACLLLALWLGSASGKVSEPELRSQQSLGRDKEDQASADAAAKAYLRLGAWNLDAAARDKADMDLATTAEVLRRFDAAVIQSPGEPEDLEALLIMLRASTARDWRAISPDKQSANPALIWDAARVIYERHQVFAPEFDGLVTPIVVAQMRWQGKPFFLAGVQILRSSRVNYQSQGDLVRRFLENTFSRFNRSMPPIFVGLASTPEQSPESMKWLHGLIAPILKNGDLTLSGGISRPDNVMTNFRRPVRTGTYPYHKALIIDNRVAATSVSGHLPVIVLTNLTE